MELTTVTYTRVHCRGSSKVIVAMAVAPFAHLFYSPELLGSLVWRLYENAASLLDGESGCLACFIFRPVFASDYHRCRQPRKRPRGHQEGLERSTNRLESWRRKRLFGGLLAFTRIDLCRQQRFRSGLGQRDGALQKELSRPGRNGPPGVLQSRIPLSRP